MNALKSTGAITVVAVLLAAGQARAEDRLKIDENGRSATLDCGGREVAIGGSRNQITLRGACDEVDVKGSDNTIRIERATKLEIWGSRNTIGVVATKKIQVAGDDNRTQYVRGLTKKHPVTKSWGKRNRFERVTALAAADAAPADDAPAAGDGAGSAGDGAGSAKAAPARREARPITCQRNDRVDLDGVVIRTAGVAVTAEGNCRLSITNSTIVSTDGAAIMTAGSSVVTLDGVEIEGKHGSVMNAGSATVAIRRATLRGVLGIQGSSTVRVEHTTVRGGRSVTSSAIYVDGGGNTFLDR